MLVTSEAAASRLGLEPRGQFVSFGIAGSIRTGCCTATRLPASERSPRRSLSWDDIAVIEVNEAFACVVLQFLKDTGRASAGRSATSTRTGAASRSSLLGATSPRITATRCSWAPRRRDARYGIASMCIGQGQAIAAVVERL